MAKDIKKVKSKPILDGKYWMIGDNPDLGNLNGKKPYPGFSIGETQECVDHHIFQTEDGSWHLWGCIRSTAVGRILYHWKAESLTRKHWKQTGEYIRADASYGESLQDDGYSDLNKDEIIQSPFIIHNNGLYYMFYGGGPTRTDLLGHSLPKDDPGITWQICLMTSKDGKNWTRLQNKDGHSRLFKGPGFVRDPCVLKIEMENENLWLLYYAGYFDNNLYKPAFFVRTSKDLISWSDNMIIHYDISGMFGSGSCSCECPHVAKREGYYYLFRTEHYPSGKTHVFRSENPFDFGIVNARDKFVCSIYCAAPEIIVDSKTGEEYITSNHDLTSGTQICKLKWVNE